MSKYINEFPQHFISPGVPAAFYKVYFGEPNQDPKANTKAPFSDAARTVAISPTQTLDATGRYTQEIFLDGGYSIQIDDTDGVLWDEDAEIYGNDFSGSIETVIHERHTATNGQTVFTLANAYVVGTNSISTYANAARLANSADFTETDPNTVTLASPRMSGDIIDFYIGVATTSLSNANASAIVYTPAGTGAVTSSAQAKLRESVSVKDFGAVGDGVSDDTVSINLAIAHCKTLIVNNTPPELDYGEINLVFPPGIYSVSTLDFTDIKLARNFHVSGRGAVLLANTASKPVIDCIGSRWLWFDGILVYSPASVTAKSGIQLGPIGTETNGNNKFTFVQCIGYYSLAPVTNWGSETTQYYSCRFLNLSATSTTYAGYFDGQAIQTYTSDYQTVTRGSGVGVSFTANKFYGCQLRHQGAGQSVYLAKTTGWEFDSGCYLLAFTGAAVVLYSTTASRSDYLTIDGLIETKQSPGLEHVVRFIGDASSTSMNGLSIRSRGPSHKTSFFANDTGSTLRLSQLSLTYQAPELFIDGTVTNVPLVEASSGITIHGSISCRNGLDLNLDDLAAFYGDIFVEDLTTVTLPTVGNYNLEDETGKRISTFLDELPAYATWEALTVSTGTLTFTQKYNSLNEGSPVNATDLSTTFGGLVEVVFRNLGANAVTFKHDTAKLRNNSGADIVLAQHQSVRYAFISGVIWQEV